MQLFQRKEHWQNKEVVLTSLESQKIGIYKSIVHELMLEKSRNKFYCSKDFFLLEYSGVWEESDCFMHDVQLTEKKMQILKELDYLLALTWHDIQNPSPDSESYSNGITILHPIHMRNSEYSIASRIREVCEYSWLPIDRLLYVRIFSLKEPEKWHIGRVPWQIRKIREGLEQMKEVLVEIDDITKIEELSKSHLDILSSQIVKSLQSCVADFSNFSFPFDSILQFLEKE